MSEGRTKYTLSQLQKMADELNQVMKLNPPINLHLDKDGMEDHLLEACRLIDFQTDNLTVETYNAARDFRRNFNKYVRFQHSKTKRVANYLMHLLKQEKYTRNVMVNMAVRHFKGSVSKSLIERTLSFGRRPGHKYHFFGNKKMSMDPVTKIERLIDVDET